MIKKSVEYARQPKTEAESMELAFEQLKQIFPRVEKESQLRTKNATSMVVDILVRSANGQLIFFEVKFVPPGRTLAYSEYPSLAALKDAVADISPEAWPIVVLLVAGHVDEPVRTMFARSGIPVVALAPTPTETRDRLRDAFQQLAIYLPELAPALAGLFIVAFYKATEEFWEKAFDIPWEGVNEELKERFFSWVGKDKESERRTAFAKAVAIARANTLRYAVNRQQTVKILDMLNEDEEGAQALAKETAKLMLFSAVPDVLRLTTLCQEKLRWDALWDRETPPAAETVASVLSDFLANLREAMLDQPAYHDLIQREMLRALREGVAELRPREYDTEATYRAQVAEMYRQLEFVGIPELKERRPITVEDIFIHLRAEREAEPEAERELLEAYRRAEERGDKETLAQLREVRNRLVHAPAPKARIAIEEALRETNRLVVLGDPGAGKTTLLKYLAVICAEGRAEAELGLKADGAGSPLPVFIPLREFATEATGQEGSDSLLGYLYAHARDHLLLNLPPGFFEEALDAGRCLVCLDGLDEVWAVGQRKAVRDAVKSLAGDFPRSRYLVTSRIVGYGEAPLDRRDFTHHTILPFEDENIRDFVRKWYEARERDPVQRRRKADDLIATIEREPRIRSLAQNPLLLTIIALVHRIEAELPHERVKLYDKCVTALVETWEEVKGLSLEEKQRPFYRYRRRLLERLAYELHIRAEEPGQLQTVKEGDLELLLARFLMENRRLGLADDPDGARDEARAFVHLARGRTGLLVERGEGVFGFPHLTFQEYLAACDIENRLIHWGVDAIWEEIEPRLHDPHWREVILLLLGSLNKYDEPPTLLVERILEAGKDDKFEPMLHRHLYLATRALADRVDVAADLRWRVVDALFEIARTAPSWERRDALTALSWPKGDRYAAEGLLALARDLQMEAEMRSAAASALGQLDCAEEAVLDGLLMLARAPQVEDRVRSEAAEALGQLRRTDEAAEVLLALARNLKVDAGVRTAAALALVRLGRADEAAEVLLALARDSQVETVERSVATLVLWQMGRADEAAEVLLALARDSQVETVERSVVAFFLGYLGRAEEAAEILLSLACDPKVDAEVRSVAALFLGQLGRADEKVLESLLALARDEKVDNEVRSAAASALGELGWAEGAGEILQGLAQDKTVAAGVRRAAASALGQLGWAEEAVEILQGLAQDKTVGAGVRCAAASKLGQLGQTEEAVEILLKLAQDEEVDAEVRRNATEALGQLGRAEEAEEVLLGLARDEEMDAVVRSAAYESLKALVATD